MIQQTSVVFIILFCAKFSFSNAKCDGDLQNETCYHGNHDFDNNIRDGSIISTNPHNSQNLLSTDWITHKILLRIKHAQCKEDISKVLENLSPSHLWALKMFDSNGKISSNILSGNINHLGDFDQCLTVQHESIQGKYCLALVDVETSPQASISVKSFVQKIRGYNFINSKRTDPGHFIPTYSTIKWGLCIPQSCQAIDIMEALNGYFNSTFESYQFTINTLIEERFCETKDNLEKPFPIAFYLALSFFGSLLCLTLYSTKVDDLNTPLTKMTRSKRCLLIFSLKRNLKQLFHNKSEDIGCIHGLRSVSTLMLFWAHNTIPIGTMPFMNRNKLTEVLFAPYSTIFRSSSVYTDTFLCLSGVLSSYYLQNSSILSRIGNRCLRMIPNHLAVVLFTMSIWPYLNSGPLWNYVVKTNADLCSQNWWKNLLHIQNLSPFEEMCAPQTHHLAVDFQLFLMTIPLTCGLKRNPVLISIGMFLINIFSAVLRYSVIMQNQLSLIIYTGARLEDLYKSANLSYILALHRVSPYISGVWLGFILYHIKFHSVKINQVTVYTGWSISSLGLAYCLFSNYNAGAKDYRYDPQEAARYGALCPVLSSMGICWIILACSTGHGGFLNSFLSSRVMYIFSKVSFSIYLVQFCVFFYNLGTIRYPQEFSFSHMVALDQFCIVIFFALLLTMLIDLPTQNFKNYVLR